MIKVSEEKSPGNSKAQLKATHASTCFLARSGNYRLRGKYSRYDRDIGIAE